MLKIIPNSQGWLIITSEAPPIQVFSKQQLLSIAPNYQFQVTYNQNRI